MERLDVRLKAAELIAEWFGLIQKSPPQIETGRESPNGNTHQTGNLDDNPSDADGKVDGAAVVSGLRYMKEVEDWFKALIVRRIEENEKQYVERRLKEVKARLYASHQAGVEKGQKAQSKAA